MSSTTVPLDLEDIQGDIVLGLPKKVETFVFFRINPDKVPEFRNGLAKIIPLITTTADVQEDHQKIATEKRRARIAGTKAKILPLGGFNIAFSSFGIQALGIAGKSGDEVFDKGMNLDSASLGDGEWRPEFLDEIHGVLLVTGHCAEKVTEILDSVLKPLGYSIMELFRVNGKVRPEPVEAHEHFGYTDGIAQPIVLGLPGTIHPGKDVIDQGIIFAGRNEDPHILNRPAWAIDGSFMVFRKLKQLVPEFNAFLEKNALPTSDQTQPDPKIGRLSAGAELLGARLVGRWKSGAPTELTPGSDKPSIATHPHLNDDFRYNQTTHQERCPFAAHTRKTNPRDDSILPNTNRFRNEARRIMRHGIQYGEEVSNHEKKTKTSSTDPDLERGLLFVCYQSSITNGFQFIQQSWVNNASFPLRKPFTQPVENAFVDAGHDALIGVSADGPEAPRFVNGHHPAHPPTFQPSAEEKDKQQLELDKLWVIPQGGEYFFSPSICALKKIFAGVADEGQGGKGGYGKDEL